MNEVMSEFRFQKRPPSPIPTAWGFSPPRFAELFALANSVPGPSSTQLVGAISAVLFGGGVMGGLLGLFFFMTPGAIVMGCLGILAGHFSGSVTDLRENSPAFQAVVSGERQLPSDPTSVLPHLFTSALTCSLTHLFPHSLTKARTHALMLSRTHLLIHTPTHSPTLTSH